MLCSPLGQLRAAGARNTSKKQEQFAVVIGFVALAADRDLAKSPPAEISLNF